MLKLFKNLGKREWFFFALAICFILGQVWLDLKMPDYMSEITVLVQSEGSSMKDILINGGFMLLCALGSLISSFLVGYFASNIAATFSKNTRKKLFVKVENMAMEDIKKFQTSSLITRTTNDITQVEMLIGMGMQLLIRAPITAIWAITKILNKNFTWSSLTAVAVVILLSVIITLMFIVLPRFKIVQKLIDNLNGVTRENLQGIRVIRAFNAENYQEEKFAKANNELTNLQLFNQRMFAILSPIMYLVMNGLALSIYFVGAYLIKEAMLTDKLALFGDMIVFSSYSMQVIMSFLMLAMIFMILPRAEVSAKRINEVLDTEEKIKDGKISENKTEEIGTIEFKNVSFKYPDAEEYLLKNISFEVQKGETVAFLGSTGSGKSTLIHLIPRFYDVTDGSILVDGVDVKDYTLNSLRDKIGFVPQKAVLFHGSVDYNVSFGAHHASISKEKIKEAIEVAQAKDFVEKMEGKYDAEIAQGGSNISGGQKQRLAIARAIAKDPEIYIFDDSFSALDYKTDATLRKELKKYTKNATTLIVAQRIGTVLNADKIIVLEHGECVGMGTHEELLKTCKVYQEIAYSQVTKEELENA